MRPPVTYALLPLLVGLTLWNNYKDILVVFVISTIILWCVGLLLIRKKRKYYTYKTGFGIIIGVSLVIISKQRNYQETETLYEQSNIILYEMPPREIKLSIRLINQKEITSVYNAGYSICTGIIIDVPNIRKDLIGKKIIWYTNENKQKFILGDIVQCFGVMRRLKDKETNLISRNISYQIKISEIVMIKESEQFLSNIKRKIHLEFTSGKWYNAEAGGFVYAILMGNKSMLRPEKLDLFMKTGTMHLFAVSGLHVGIIYLIISSLLNRLNSRRVIWIPTSLLLVFCYVALVDFSPSACRAFGMITLWQIGLLLNKKRNPLSCLYLTAIILLTINPDYLFSIGFQLSFTVVLNIIFIIGNKINNKDLSLVRLFCGTFIISYTSFFGSLLLVIDNFHFVNPISIVINAILVNTIFFIFIILFVQITWTTIFGDNFLITVVEVIYDLIDIIINWFHQNSFFHIHFSESLDIPNAFHLVYPVILICITQHIGKTWQKLVVLSILPITFLLIS